MVIKVVGCGGIGSYFAQHIDRLVETKQITTADFFFYDDDVVELKNILYQNFSTKDIDSNKADALSMRYFNITFRNKRLSIDDLSGDLSILCADNNKIRKEAWKNWIDNKIPFIDARANGRAVGIFSNETPNYEDTLSKDDTSSSCQNPFQIAKKEIEFGNVVIAAILAQVTLNYLRLKTLPVDVTINI
jgi:molybdopterin/thiamine biosynthesis adenylyltransferase